MAWWKVLKDLVDALKPDPINTAADWAKKRRRDDDEGTGIGARLRPRTPAGGGGAKTPGAPGADDWKKGRTRGSR